MQAAEQKSTPYTMATGKQIQTTYKHA